MSALTWWELRAFAWSVRVLGGLAVVALLAFAAYGVVTGALRVARKWQWLREVSWLWFVESRSDRAKFRRAVERWSAWRHDEERERLIDAERERLRRHYQQREAYLRQVYAAEDMPEDTEPTASDNRGTDGRDDLV